MRQLSLIKRRNTYHAKFDIPAGVDDSGKPIFKQVMRSTGASDRTEATKNADAIRMALIDEAGASDEKSREIYRVLRMAGEAAMQGRLSEPEARLMLRDMFEIATGARLKFYTVRDWFDEWQKRKAVGAKPATMKRYKYASKRFLEFLGMRADERLENVSTELVRAYQRESKAAGRAAKTVNGYVKDVGSAFSLAVKDGLLLANPVAGIESLPETDSIGKKPFTVKEMKAIFSNLKGEWKTLAALGVFTGLRLQDAAKLRWSNVDLAADLIRVMPAKTDRKKKKIELPILPELKECLLALPSSDDSNAFVLQSLAKKSVSGTRGLSTIFGDLIEKMGIDRGIRKAEGAGRAVSEKSFHSLRHTFITSLANVDVPEELRMKLAGQSSRDVHAIYTHSEIETLRRAVEKMPRFTA
jgi:integrase